MLYNPQGGNGITVEKCNVTGATYGVGAQKATNVLVKDYTYSGKAAGFYGRATSNDCFTTLENVNITTTLDGQSAVTLWKNDDGTTSDTYIFNFVGENVLTSSEGTASFARQSESNSPYELLLGDVNATLAATEGLNVTTEIAGYDVIYEAGVYKLIDSSVFVAQVKETNKKYFSLAEAYEAAEEGQTVVLLQDVTLNEIFAIEKAITFDGNSFTLTSTAGRAINVDCADAVAINNLTVATTNNTERAINVIQKAAQLTLNNVTAEGFKYTINVATSAAGSTITTNGGKYSGYAAVNIAAGNTTFTSNETEFVGVNDVPQHESNNYAVIAVNAVPTQNVNVNINGGKVIAQTNENRQFILLVEDADNTNITIDAELEIANGDVLNAAIQEGLTLKFRDDYAETLMDQGYTTSEPDTEGLVTVIGNPVARIVETGRYYATIDSAIAAAEAGQTVIVVTGQYNQELTINKAITVDCEDGMIEVIKLNITADGANAKHIYTFNGGGEGAYINAKDVLIEDCVIQGMNGIYQSYASGTVRFSYSYIGGAIYGINFGGSSNGNIIIENCEVAGWTSFASSITNVAVENTTFTTTGYPENDQLRFYQNAQLTNCSFPASMTIDFGKNEVRADFNGCTVENDMLLTDIIYLGDIVEMGVKAYENGELIIVEARVATIENGVVDTENARYFLKLVDAVASEIHDGEIVTVHATVEGAGLAINQDITIDFNGHTYTINQAEGSNGTKSQGFQILPDADNVIIRNGNINIAEGTHVVWMINDYAAELTVENMIFDCQNIDLPANGDASNVYFIVLNNQHGTNPNVTFNNVTIDNFAAEYGYAYYMEPGTQFTAMAGLAIETDPGYEVIYVNGTYYVREIVTDGEAQIGDIIYATFADAYEAAIDGDEIVILKDITFNDIVEISKSITIDINEKTLTGTAQKLFRVFNDVTFENGNIVNNTNNGRCVETRTGDIELNLNNVSLIADNGASQPLTIGGSGDNIIVNVNTSVINAGATGYAVIVFNPVVMNIDYSTVEGWSALYFKGEDNSLGSAGSVVEVNNSELNGVNNVAAQDPSNTFATIQFEDENVTLNVNGDSKLRASEEVYNHQYLFSLVETNNIKINVASGVIFSSAHILICDLLGNAEIIVPAFYSEDIKEEGYWPENYGNDQVIIRQQFIAVASIGETLYQSLEDAYEAAVAGDVIMLLKDVETEYDSYDLTNVTLNLNGKTIYTQSDFVGNNFTITNGTVDGRNASYGLRIAEASDVVIDNINVVGGINVSDASNVTLTNNTVNGTDDYAVMAGENVVDLEIKSGTYYGAEGMDAVFHVGESEVITTGGTYNSNVELAGYCPEGYYAHDNGNDTWTVIRSAVLEVELAQDWNWFSSYVDIDGTQGFSALTNALTGFGSQIKAENGQYSNYNNAFGEWVGSLTSTSTDKMYKIYASQAGTVYIEGTAAQEVEITLYPGLNWIAYPIDKPLNIVDAFRNHTPTNGDQLRTIDSYVEYTDFGDPEWADYNGWYETNGDLNVMTLIPGQGYIYDSKADTPVTFIFNADAPAVTAKSSDSHGYWKVNPHLYPSNMTITAVLNIDGKLAEGNYEIAAFSNGECRGSARAIYVEPLKQYVTMLLVHGDGVENLTFKCYDVDADMVYELDNMIVYSDNARLGSMREPYVFNRNTTGVDENSSAMINIYPNPTTTNSTINLNAVYDKVEVFNSVGVKIAEYANVDNIDPLQTAGVYVIRISNNNDVTHCRLVVK